MIRADGESWPAIPASARQRSAPETGFIRDNERPAAAGQLHVAAGVIDGVERIVPYRKIPDLPLYVIHGSRPRRCARHGSIASRHI